MIKFILAMRQAHSHIAFRLGIMLLQLLHQHDDEVCYRDRLQEKSVNQGLDRGLTLHERQRVTVIVHL